MFRFDVFSELEVRLMDVLHGCLGFGQLCVFVVEGRFEGIAFAEVLIQDCCVSAFHLKGCCSRNGVLS